MAEVRQLSSTSCNFPTTVGQRFRQLRFRPRFISSVHVRTGTIPCDTCGSDRGRDRDREHGSVLNRDCVPARSNSICDFNCHGIGFTKGRAGATARSCRRPSRVYRHWVVNGQAARTGAVGRRSGGGFGDGCDAPNQAFHPPAGIDPLVVVVNNMSWSFLIVPVGIGALLLAAFAFVWHNIVARGANKSDTWPTRWW